MVDEAGWSGPTVRGCYFLKSECESRSDTKYISVFVKLWTYLTSKALPLSKETNPGPME